MDDAFPERAPHEEDLADGPSAEQGKGTDGLDPLAGHALPRAGDRQVGTEGVVGRRQADRGDRHLDPCDEGVEAREVPLEARPQYLRPSARRERAPAADRERQRRTRYRGGERPCERLDAVARDLAEEPERQVELLGRDEAQPPGQRGGVPAERGAQRRGGIDRDEQAHASEGVSSPREVAMGLKERRAALGWDRAELARRTGLDKRVVQLVELGQWTEPDALARVEEALWRAEAGESDVVLPPLRPPER